MSARLLGFRLATRVRMRSEGYGFRKINRALFHLDEETIEYASKKCGVEIPDFEEDPVDPLPVDPVEPEEEVGPIRAFFKWLFTSEEGKQILGVLITILLGFLKDEESVSGIPIFGVPAAMQSIQPVKKAVRNLRGR